MPKADPKTLILAALSLTVLFSVSTLIALPLEQVGWVQDYALNHPDSRYTRQGKSLDPKILMPVYKGDEIHVVGDDALLLNIGNEPIVVDVKNTPYTVAQSIEDVTVSSKVLAWAASFFESSSDERFIDTVAAVSRDGGMQSLQLSPVGNKITQRQSLLLTWQDGEPPFIITLKDTKATHIELESIQTQHVEMDISALKLGVYSILIADKESTIDRTIEIVSVDQRPPLNSGLKCFNRIHCDLLWVIEQIRLGNEEWLLESYQIAHQYAHKSQLAKAIKRQLQ